MNTKLLIYLLLLVPLKSTALEVKVAVHDSPNIERFKGPAISLVVEVVNDEEESIELGELNGALMQCEIELWNLGKGVKLRNKTDAEWRRKQAFAGWGSTTLMPGESKRYIFKLRDLQPDDPDNDDFGKSLVEDIERFRSGDGCVVVRYGHKGKGRKSRVARGGFIIPERPQ